jgi:membrane protein YdbS with pleckstrin-like domain
MNTKRDSIEKNFFMGRLLVGVANLLAMILFIVAYSVQPNVWYLIAAGGLIVATIVFLIFVRNQEKKYHKIKQQILEQQKNINNKNDDSKS